ncbi:MAG TPA: fumarylacetoacetate hydrolase family protein [Alphaproteobacteria bacterium]|nr:fumarylacetoacetate hydrolase family protein [Alphaproteobacteria bacterium]
MTDTAKAKEAAAYLIGKRAKDAALPDFLPDDLRPSTLDEVIAIQLATMAELGPVGGWKVGTENAAPLPASGIKFSPATVASRRRMIEGEIGFRLGDALPPRDIPYNRAEVLRAIAFCMATIEVVDPRYRDHTILGRPDILADLGMHGGLVVGRPIAAWNPEMFASLSVTLDIDGAFRRRNTASNPGGTDLIALVTWLANSAVARAFGGLQAGTTITTGSWTGMEIPSAGGGAVAKFDGFPEVEVRFAE